MPVVPPRPGARGRAALAPRPAQPAPPGPRRPSPPADVAHRVGVIADDSMLGRDTPSRGLELTAHYVADQFRRFGLRPGGDDGGWFQRYAITRRQFDRDAARGCRRSGGVEAESRASTGPARLVQGAVPRRADHAGRRAGGRQARRRRRGQHAAPRQGRDLRRRRQRAPERARRPGGPRAPAGRAQGRAARGQCGPRAVRPADAAHDHAPDHGGPRAREPPVHRGERGGGRAGASRGEGRPREHPGATPRRSFERCPASASRVELRDSVLESLTAPNTVGILEGSDPVLRKRVPRLLGPHGPHRRHAGQPDSVNNGADDDASGTTGVMELAEAFSRPGGAAEAVGHLPDGERRGEGPLGQPLLQRASRRCRSTTSSPTSTST